MVVSSAQEEFVGFSMCAKVATAHSKELTHMAASENRLLTCSKDATARVYLTSGAELEPHTVFKEHRINTMAGALAGDGGLAASCGSDGTGTYPAGASVAPGPGPRANAERRPVTTRCAIPSIASNPFVAQCGSGEPLAKRPRVS